MNFNTMFSFIAQPLSYLLTGIYDFANDYGISIILFTLIVRGCLFPLYASQIKSQMKMQTVQPKMKEIQRKYANDREEMNRRMMELYREEKFNPASGCLPLLIQFPILLGLYTLLRNPLAFIPESATDMVLAIHDKFFWINDLSQPDQWVLPIMAGVTTFLSFTLTQGQTPETAGMGQMQGMMKMMKYFFPVMIVWMGHTFPAGLTLYWFTGNLFTIGQYQILKRLRKNLAATTTQGKG
ncbi:MAG: YidC/Oxa1 family membrane protein insertase [Clostridiales Family XIII bacterium]|nr:YidC/Oxa1 family membrane protein insertase [Clostridiales Family XIII bacterium]